MKIQLDLPRHFSFEHCYRFLNRSDRECTHRCDQGRIYKLIPIEAARPILLEISGEKAGITIKILNRSASKSESAQIKNFVRQWFDLDRELEPFYQLVKTDKLLSPLTQRYAGLRLITLSDLFEALCWAITGQQINLQFAYSLKQRLAENFGVKLQYQEQDYFLFPKPKDLASIDESDLRPLQFSQRKAEYIIGVARLMTNGDLHKPMLEQLDFAEAKATLESIRGIGSWTANYVLMKCLRYPDAYPIKDVGLHNAVKNLLNLAQKPSLQTLEELSQNWSGWRGYATFYLWYSLLD